MSTEEDTGLFKFAFLDFELQIVDEARLSGSLFDDVEPV
jgi:hypothetical protein